MKHVAFFGDGEKTFSLDTLELINELENRCGHGLGAVWRRISTQDFTFFELLEVIRLALIGGGSTPQEAAKLVSTYGVGRPIAETLEIAVAVLAKRYFGADEAAE